MKISTKGRYALRMLIYLAKHNSEEYVSLKIIAEEEDISKKYLEQIVPILNKTDILLTNRGFQGGYRIGRSPSKITVGEVLRLTEGSLSPVACMSDIGTVNCPRNAYCPTLPVWQGLNKVVNEYLDSITIQDVIDQAETLESNNYVI